MVDCKESSDVDHAGQLLHPGRLLSPVIKMHHSMVVALHRHQDLGLDHQYYHHQPVEKDISLFDTLLILSVLAVWSVGYHNAPNL